MRFFPLQPALKARPTSFRGAVAGNLTITFAFAAMPILFALGAAADYGMAVKSRSRMDAAADAAALAAVTPQQMSLPITSATTAATQMFNAQVAGLTRVSYTAPLIAPPCVSGTSGATPPAGVSFCVTVSESTVSNQRVRTATVAYQATSQTAFSKILRMGTITIGGTSTATASSTPNIDFYLLLDTSPSMAIPSSQAGIDAMVKLTPYQDHGGGCAFACHENSPAKESGYDPQNGKPLFANPGCPDDPLKRSGPCLDNYQLAINNNIPLRIQLVNQAVQNLVDTAKDTATKTGAGYQLAGYTFDVAVAQAFALQTPSDTTKTQAKNNINMLVVDSENSNNGDQNTVFDTINSKANGNSANFSSPTSGAFPYLYYTMTNSNGGKGPGTGSNITGDRPQQVLMLVTDGVSDQPWTGNARIYNPIGGATNISADTNDWCTKIKANTNIRIAVLYLVYNPLPSTDGKGNQSWYTGHVAPIQNDIAPTLQNCASSGLFYQVNNGGDISSALSALFRTAAGGAHLSY